MNISIVIIETKNGVFVGHEKTERGWNLPELKNLYFDGDFPEKTFDTEWVKIKKVPEKIERMVYQPDINERYELVDKTLASEKIKDRLEISDITKNDDGYWTGEYAPLRSLYTIFSDKQPDIKEVIEFKIANQIKVDTEIDFFGFKYPVQKSEWSHDGFLDLTEKSVTYELLDKIQLPEILLPLRPVGLTSEQTYKIIRKHVQDNINPKAAVITSDYEFCFTVERKIPTEPVAYQYDENMFKKRSKPKIVTKYRNTRQVKIFEMTHDKRKYSGYPIIEGFKGENLKQLKENIDKYLSNLMSEINKELQDCPNCKGQGVVEVNKKGE